MQRPDLHWNSLAPQVGSERWEIIVDTDFINVNLKILTRTVLLLVAVVQAIIIPVADPALRDAPLVVARKVPRVRARL